MKFSDRIINAMKKNKTIGKILIICGCTLSLIGIILFFNKKHSIVSIMSLPIIFLGIFIWLNSEKTSSATALKDS